MLVPQRLEDWTAERIEALAAEAVGEDQRFDFKSASAIRAGDSGRISATVCAFANTKGGFIVFGVEERKDHSGWDCNPGPLNTEAPKLINDKIKVDPAPSFPAPFLVPKDGKAYYILHVPASPYSTHSAGGVYYYRSLSGNESMPPEMLRERILGQAERKGRVRVLLQELDEVFIQAGQHAPPTSTDFEPDLTPFDLSTILRVRADLHLAMSADADTIESLRLALSAIKKFNGVVNLASQQLASTSLPRVRRDWRIKLHAESRPVKQAVNRARLAVARTFGEQVGNWASNTSLT
jgi:hypothetical protein